MTNQARIKRIGFRLQVHPARIDAYRAHHAAVWPEMLAALRRCGWQNYSLFLDDDGSLFGYFETTGTLQDSVTAMQNEPINERWQALMGPYFVTGEAPADQQMRELDEVFHLD
jgi:L-rhamnose mutarotase